MLLHFFSTPCTQVKSSFSIMIWPFSQLTYITRIPTYTHLGILFRLLYLYDEVSNEEVRPIRSFGSGRYCCLQIRQLYNFSYRLFPHQAVRFATESESLALGCNAIDCKTFHTVSKRPHNVSLAVFLYFPPITSSIIPVQETLDIFSHLNFDTELFVSWNASLHGY